MELTMRNCSIENCKRDYYARGYCSKHYQRIYKKEYTKNRYRKNPEKYINANKRHRIKKRNIIIDHYGSKCVCCGETDYRFLTIDHINGGGTKQRRESKINNSDQLYSWIIKNSFPNDLQLMCYNCNCGRARNKGICPHKLIGIKKLEFKDMEIIDELIERIKYLENKVAEHEDRIGHDKF